MLSGESVNTLRWGLLGIGLVIVLFLLLQTLWQSWQGRRYTCHALKKTKPKANIQKHLAPPFYQQATTTLESQSPLPSTLAVVVDKLSGEAPAEAFVTLTTSGSSETFSSSTPATSGPGFAQGFYSSIYHGLLDSRIDSLATLPLPSPLPGSRILASLPKTWRVGSKAFAVEGLPVTFEEKYTHAPEINAARAQSKFDTAWQPIQLGRYYGALRTGVQLANRTGPLNTVEFSEFVLKTQSLAEALELENEMQFANMQEEVARARALDQFAQMHDARVCLVLHTQQLAQPWRAALLHHHATALGFTAGTFPGTMAWHGQSSANNTPNTISTTTSGPWLHLTYRSALAFAEDFGQKVNMGHKATIPEDTGANSVPSADNTNNTTLLSFALSLDLPLVPQEAKALDALRELSQALAEALHARVTDEDGRPITPDHWPGIYAQMDKLYRGLEAAGLPAGSALARRLFS